jgi:hypothetical protein
MGEPVEFDGCNLRLLPPAGDEDTVMAMYAFRNGRDTVSCWRLAESELEEVMRTGCVWLDVATGRSPPPPVYVGSGEAVRALAADVGVWRRGSGARVAAGASDALQELSRACTGVARVAGALSRGLQRPDILTSEGLSQLRSVLLHADTALGEAASLLADQEDEL